MTKLIVVVVALFAVPSFAKDPGSSPRKKVKASRCVIAAQKGDRVVERGALVLEAGSTTHDAIALEGSVLVKKGATVHDVVAMNGTVTIEEGAMVTGNVVALAGDLEVAPGAQVSGDAIVLGGALRVADGAKVSGDRVSLNLDIGGESLMKSILDSALGEGRCVVTRE